MTAGFALSIKRLYGPGIVRAASKHLLRELASELGADSHIDVERIADNIILRGPGTAAEVADLAKSLMEQAGVVKCRKGAVMCLELLFTLPPSADVEPRLYFERATTWAEQHFGVPVLSCVAHADEGPWHAHALLLPLIAGHMVGSDLHGGKAKLAAMQASFHESVGAPHGLPKFTPQKRLSAPVRTAAIELARAALQANSALTDAVIEALLTPHAKDPAPLLLALGISMPSAQRVAKGSFIDLMTKPVPREPQSRIGKLDHNHIGKATQAASVPAFPESCVGKGIAHALNPAAEQPPLPATPITADHHTNRTNIVRLVEQRQSDANQRQSDDTRLSFQDAPAASDEKRTKAPTTRATAHSQLSFEPRIDQRQHSAENSAQHVKSVQPRQPATTKIMMRAVRKCGEMLRDSAARGERATASANLMQSPKSNDATSVATLADIGITRDQSSRYQQLAAMPEDDLQTVKLARADQVDDKRRAGAGAAPLSPSPAIRTMPAQVPAQPGIVENTEPGFTSEPTTTATGGSERRRPAQSPAGNGAHHLRAGLLPRKGELRQDDDFHRQRDSDHLAATWCSDRGEFVSGSGPPPSACHLSPLTKHADPAAAPGTTTERQHHETETEQRRLGRRPQRHAGLRTAKWRGEGNRRRGSMGPAADQAFRIFAHHGPPQDSGRPGRLVLRPVLHHRRRQAGSAGRARHQVVLQREARRGGRLR